MEHEFPTIVLLERQVNHDWYEKNIIPVRDIAGEGSDTVSLLFCHQDIPIQLLDD